MRFRKNRYFLRRNFYEQGDQTFFEEYRGNDDIYTTGGAAKGHAEKRPDIKLPDEYIEYLSECGLLMAFGFDLHGISPDGSAAFVDDTLRLREKGQERQYVVIRNVGEYVSENGEVLTVTYKTRSTSPHQTRQRVKVPYTGLGVIADGSFVDPCRAVSHRHRSHSYYQKEKSGQREIEMIMERAQSKKDQG